MHRILCTLLILILAGAVSTVAQSSGSFDILPLAEVEAGQMGVGLTVFGGVEPREFEVEILGIWRNTSPDTSFILARLAGQGLADSGVIAGMSGSPVYIDGRLVGAVSFAWPFSVEPIAGITPIEAMTRLLSGDQQGARIESSAAAEVSLEKVAAMDFSDDYLEKRLSALVVRPLAETHSGLMWSAIGFGSRSRQILKRGLGDMSPAGKSVSTASTTLLPGSAVAAVLIEGDLQLAATGTVTSRSGSEVFAFGHPFLDSGHVELPMATVEVVTVISSRLSSFKIANLGETVGAVDLDRMTGIRGQVGQIARMTPMTIAIQGDRDHIYEMRLARVPSLTPLLAAISILGALDSTTQAGGEQSLDLAVSFDLGEQGVLEVTQSFDGAAAGQEAAVYALALSDYLLNNHLESVEMERITVSLTQHPESRMASLVEAHATRTLVRPGDRIGLNLDFLAFRGDRWRQSLEVEIPTGIPDGRYALLVGDGVSIDVARLTLEQSIPVTFEQALEFLQSLHSRRDLVVLGVFGGAGLSVAGEVLPRLPQSVRSVFSAAASSSAVPLHLAIAQQQEITMDVPIAGAVRVDVEVRRQEPLAPEGSNQGTGSEGPAGPGPGVTGSGQGRSSQPGKVDQKDDRGGQDG